MCIRDSLSCVWTYAKTIGELEGLDADTQFILEVAAIKMCIRDRNGAQPYTLDRRSKRDVVFFSQLHNLQASI